jgi:hypothetical protein
MQFSESAPFGQTLDIDEFRPCVAESWAEDLRASLGGPSGELAAHEMDKASLEDGVHWSLRLPSDKRIQVVDGPFGGVFLELRQYKLKDGDFIKDRVKFLRLSKV